LSKVQVETTNGLSVLNAGQYVHMDLCYGFMCLNSEQNNEKCLDYRIRMCCQIAQTNVTELLSTTDITTELPSSTIIPTELLSTTDITTELPSSTIIPSELLSTTDITTELPSSTTDITTELPECTYDIDFENMTKIMTVKENEKHFKIHIEYKQNHCFFAKLVRIKVETKSSTALDGSDFKGKEEYISLEE
jgi:hypothetical protein